jgi:hypothetical protein
MSFKQIAFYLGCAISWFVALPVFVVGGGIALFVYAVFAEIGEVVAGGPKKSDASDARELARLMCIGH